MKGPSTTITPTQLAKKLTVSYSTVMKAIHQGRLSHSVMRESDGRYYIDQNLALQEWEKAALLSMPKIEGDSEATPPYKISRALRESYQAKLAKLTYEQKSGQLISREEVERAAFELGHTVRDALLAIPKQLGPRLAGESNVTVTIRLLEEAVTQAISQITQD